MTRASVGGALALTLAVATLAAAHDLFLKLETYFVPPRATVRVAVLNGTFTVSEAAVGPERLADLSLVTPQGRETLSRALWQPSGDSTWLTLHTQKPGTYVVGASTLARVLTLSADDFNKYLKEDGLPDVLQGRADRGELGKPARERYQKHVKALLQVGEARTIDYETRLGYPAELVPLTNPYDAQVGDTLAFWCLVDGKAVPDQVVLAGGDGPGGERALAEGRSDAQGVVRFAIAAPGRWFIKFVHMVPGSGRVDYESKWATLTFEIAAP
jgi:hypothetical protein